MTAAQLLLSVDRAHTRPTLRVDRPVLDTPSELGEGLEGLTARARLALWRPLRLVKPCVRAARQRLKILRPIIRFVAIDVVRHFFGGQPPAEFLLKNPAMQADRPTVPTNGDVSGLGVGIPATRRALERCEAAVIVEPPVVGAAVASEISLALAAECLTGNGGRQMIVQRAEPPSFAGIPAAHGGTRWPSRGLTLPTAEKWVSPAKLSTIVNITQVDPAGAGRSTAHSAGSILHAANSNATVGHCQVDEDP